MHRVRQLFIALIIELVLVVVLGVMTLDNNACDIGNPWRWSFTTSSTVATTQEATACSMINVNVQSSEARFYALIIVLISIPVTAAYGYFTSDLQVLTIPKSRLRNTDKGTTKDERN